MTHSSAPVRSDAKPFGRLKRWWSAGAALLLGLPAPIRAQDTPEVAPQAPSDHGPVARPPGGGLATAPLAPGPDVSRPPDQRALLRYARGRQRANIGLGVGLTGTTIFEIQNVLATTSPDLIGDEATWAGRLGAFTAASGFAPEVIGPLQMSRALRREGVPVADGLGWLGLTIPLIGVPMMVPIADSLESSRSATLALMGIPVLVGIGLSRLQYRRNEIAFNRAGWDHLEPVSDPDAGGLGESLRMLRDVTLVLVGSTVTLVSVGGAVALANAPTHEVDGGTLVQDWQVTGLLLIGAGGAGVTLVGIPALTRSASSLEVSIAPLVAPGLYGLGVSGQF